MFVGGFLGCILDNTIPGTREERGLVKWENQLTESTDKSDTNRNEMRTYDPPFVMNLIRGHQNRYLKYLPFLPTLAQDETHQGDQLKG